MVPRVLFVGLVCAGLAATPAWAGDSPGTAKKLVSKVPADSKHQHPDYYTGAHGFMNDADLTGEATLKKGLYLMSWLVLDPPIVLASGGGVASIPKDFLKEYVGVAETDVTAKKPGNYPKAGEKAKKAGEGIAKNGMWWIPINFQDMVDAGQGALFASGNQFDWAEWGGQSLNSFHDYLFCLVKWNKGGEIIFKLGSDDPGQLWVNGAVTAEILADQNWSLDQVQGKATVNGGEWTPILAEVGENTGECALTLRVEPPPDDHTLDIEAMLDVKSQGRLALTWGHVKTMF